MAAITLPAGWTKHGDSTGTYYRRTIARTGHIDVAPEGIYVVLFSERIEAAHLALEFGQAITEAADLYAALDRPAVAP